MESPVVVVGGDAFNELGGLKEWSPPDNFFCPYFDWTFSAQVSDNFDETFSAYGSDNFEETFSAYVSDNSKQK